MEKDQLFVYGSLRSGFHHPAFEYISRHFSFVCNAKIKGIMYDAGPYPAALRTDRDSFIIGELYQIKNKNEFNWAVAQLDDYEGLSAEEEETSLFKREMTDVFVNDSSVQIRAWVYWYSGDVTGKPVIASGDSLQYYNEKNKL